MTKEMPMMMMMKAKNIAGNRFKGNPWTSCDPDKWRARIPTQLYVAHEGAAFMKVMVMVRFPIESLSWKVLACQGHQVIFYDQVIQNICLRVANL